MSRAYCVYILASRSRALYTGVTGSLEFRMVEHRQGLTPGFTTRYKSSASCISNSSGTLARPLRARKKSRAGGGKRKFGSSNVTIPPGRIWRRKFPTNTKYQMTETAKQIPHLRSPKTGDRVRDDKLKKGPTAGGAPLRGLPEPHFERRGGPSRLHFSMCCR
jgi:putative endonuclease